jgi:hypothetical protein
MVSGTANPPNQGSLSAKIQAGISALPQLVDSRPPPCGTVDIMRQP